MVEGIKEIDPNKHYEVIGMKGEDAISYAMSKATPGAFVVTLSDAVKNSVEIAQHLLEKERLH
jgi:hypothetical protein